MPDVTIFAIWTTPRPVEAMLGRGECRNGEEVMGRRLVAVIVLSSLMMACTSFGIGGKGEGELYLEGTLEEQIEAASERLGEAEGQHRVELLGVLGGLHYELALKKDRKAREALGDPECAEFHSYQFRNRECGQRHLEARQKSLEYFAKAARMLDEFLSSAASEHSDRQEAHFRRGRALWAGRDQRAAIEDFEAVVESGGGQYYHAAHRELGMVRFYEQDLERARRHFREAARSVEVEIAAHSTMMRGVIALHGGAVDEALVYLGSAIDMGRQARGRGAVDPVFTEALTQAARGLAGSKPTDEAIRWMEEHVQGEERLKGLELLAHKYVSAMKYGDAREVFERLLTLEPGPEDELHYLVNLAWIQRLQHAEERDELALEELLDYVGTSAVRGGKIEAREQTDELIIKVAEKALEDGLSGVEKKPRLRGLEILLRRHRQWYPDGDTQNDAIRLLGTVLVELGEYDEARQVLEPHCGRGHRSSCEVLERFLDLDG